MTNADNQTAWDIHTSLIVKLKEAFKILRSKGLKAKLSKHCFDNTQDILVWGDNQYNPWTRFRKHGGEFGFGYDSPIRDDQVNLIIADVLDSLGIAYSTSAFGGGFEVADKSHPRWEDKEA